MVTSGACVPWGSWMPPNAHGVLRPRAHRMDSTGLHPAFSHECLAKNAYNMKPTLRIRIARIVLLTCLIKVTQHRLFLLVCIPLLWTSMPPGMPAPLQWIVLDVV